MARRLSIFLLFASTLFMETFAARSNVQRGKNGNNTEPLIVPPDLLKSTIGALPLPIFLALSPLTAALPAGSLDNIKTTIFCIQNTAISQTVDKKSLNALDMVVEEFIVAVSQAVRNHELVVEDKQLAAIKHDLKPLLKRFVKAGRSAIANPLDVWDGKLAGINGSYYDLISKKVDKSIQSEAIALAIKSGKLNPTSPNFVDESARTLWSVTNAAMNAKLNEQALMTRFLDWQLDLAGHYAKALSVQAEDVKWYCFGLHPTSEKRLIDLISDVEELWDVYRESATKFLSPNHPLVWTLDVHGLVISRSLLQLKSRINAVNVDAIPYLKLMEDLNTVTLDAMKDVKLAPHPQKWSCPQSVKDLVASAQSDGLGRTIVPLELPGLPMAVRIALVGIGWSPYDVAELGKSIRQNQFSILRFIAEADKGTGKCPYEAVVKESEWLFNKVTRIAFVRVGSDAGERLIHGDTPMYREYNPEDYSGFINIISRALSLWEESWALRALLGELDLFYSNGRGDALSHDLLSHEDAIADMLSEMKDRFDNVILPLLETVTTMSRSYAEAVGMAVGGQLRSDLFMLMLVIETPDLLEEGVEVCMERAKTIALGYLMPKRVALYKALSLSVPKTPTKGKSSS